MNNSNIDTSINNNPMDYNTQNDSDVNSDTQTAPVTSSQPVTKDTISIKVVIDANQNFKKTGSIYFDFASPQIPVPNEDVINNAQANDNTNSSSPTSDKTEGENTAEEVGYFNTSGNTQGNDQGGTDSDGGGSNHQDETAGDPHLFGYWTKQPGQVGSPLAPPAETTTNQGKHLSSDPSSAENEPHVTVVTNNSEKLSSNGPNGSNKTISPNSTHALISNPWFNVSFLAVFNSIMAKVMDLQRKNQYFEAQIEMKTRTNMIGIAQTNATLTIALYNAQAQEKMTEAYAAFATAAVDGVGLIQMARSPGIGKSQTDNEISGQEDVVRQQGTEEDLHVADNPVELNKNVKPLKDDPTDLSPQASNRRSLSRMRESRADTTRANTQRYDQRISMAVDLGKNAITAASSLVQSSLKTQEGQLDALKQLMEGYLKAMSTFDENMNQAANKAQSDVSNSADFINRINDSDFGRHYNFQG